MEASQVVGHKGLVECQTLTCIDLDTVRLFQHGAALQESSWTQPQCLVSFAGAVGGGEATPAFHKEPVWGCVGCCRTPAARERFSSVPRCISGTSRWSPAAPACSAPAQPLTALPIKAALCVPVPPVGDKQMLLSSGAGNSSILAFHRVLGQASLLACTCSQEELT